MAKINPFDVKNPVYDEFDPTGNKAAEKFEMKNLDDMDPGGGGLEDSEILDPNDLLPEPFDDSPSTLKQEEKNKFYKYFENKGYKVDKTAHLEQVGLFRLTNKKALAMKYKNKLYRLTYIDNKNKFLAFSTLKSMFGIDFVRDVLGISEKEKKNPPTSRSSG